MDEQNKRKTRIMEIIFTKMDNADLGIVCLTILGICFSVLCYITGLKLESVLTGIVTSVAAIARSDRKKDDENK